MELACGAEESRGVALMRSVSSLADRLGALAASSAVLGLPSARDAARDPATQSGLVTTAGEMISLTKKLVSCRAKAKRIRPSQRRGQSLGQQSRTGRHAVGSSSVPDDGAHTRSDMLCVSNHAYNRHHSSSSSSSMAEQQGIQRRQDFPLALSLAPQPIGPSVGMRKLRSGQEISGQAGRKGQHNGSDADFNVGDDDDEDDDELEALMGSIFGKDDDGDDDSDHDASDVDMWDDDSKRTAGGVLGFQ